MHCARAPWCTTRGRTGGPLGGAPCSGTRDLRRVEVAVRGDATSGAARCARRRARGACGALRVRHPMRASRVGGSGARAMGVAARRGEGADCECSAATDSRVARGTRSGGRSAIVRRAARKRATRRARRSAC